MQQKENDGSGETSTTVETAASPPQRSAHPIPYRRELYMCIYITSWDRSPPCAVGIQRGRG